MKLLSFNRFQLETPSLSCEWNKQDSNLLFCGQEKCILVFDIRITNKYLQKLIGIHPKPTYSLFYLNNSSCPKFSGLYSANADGVTFWDPQKQFHFSSLPMKGNCTCLHGEGKYLLSAFRSTPESVLPSFTISFFFF